MSADKTRACALAEGLGSQLAWNSTFNFYQELCCFKVLARSQETFQGVRV